MGLFCLLATAVITSSPIPALANVVISEGNIFLGDLPTSASSNDKSINSLITNGRPIVLVAKKSILVGDNWNKKIDSSATKNGGRILMVAGANYHKICNRVYLCGKSKSGGSILLDSDPTDGNYIETFSSIGGHDGGDITIAAYSGSDDSSGVIELGQETTILSGGLKGSDGSVKVLAEGKNTEARAISIATINTKGAPLGEPGDVLIATATPRIKSKNNCCIEITKGKTITEVDTGTPRTPLEIEGDFSFATCDVNKKSSILCNGAITYGGDVLIVAGHDILSLDDNSENSIGNSSFKTARSMINITPDTRSSGSVTLIAYTGEVNTQHGSIHTAPNPNVEQSGGNVMIAAKEGVNSNAIVTGHSQSIGSLENDNKGRGKAGNVNILSEESIDTMAIDSSAKQGNAGNIFLCAGVRFEFNGKYLYVIEPSAPGGNVDNSYPSGETTCWDTSIYGQGSFNGGKITIIAHRGKTPKGSPIVKGEIKTVKDPCFVSADAGGSGSANNGNILMIAERLVNTPTIQLSKVISTGGNTSTGKVTLHAAQALVSSPCKVIEISHKTGIHRNSQYYAPGMATPGKVVANVVVNSANLKDISNLGPALGACVTGGKDPIDKDPIDKQNKKKP